MNTSMCLQTDLQSDFATSGTLLAQTALNRLKKSSQSAPVRGIEKIPSFATSPRGPKKRISDHEVLDIWVDDGTGGNIDDGTRLRRFAKAASNIDGLFARQATVNTLHGSTQTNAPMKEQNLEMVPPFDKSLGQEDQAEGFDRQLSVSDEPVTPPTASSHKSSLLRLHSTRIEEKRDLNQRNDLTMPADRTNRSEDRNAVKLVNFFKLNSTHIPGSVDEEHQVLRDRTSMENGHPSRHNSAIADEGHQGQLDSVRLMENHRSQHPPTNVDEELQAQRTPPSIRFIRKRRSQLVHLIKKISSADIRNVELKQDADVENGAHPDTDREQLRRSNHQLEGSQITSDDTRNQRNQPHLLRLLKKLSSGPRRAAERNRGVAKEDKNDGKRNLRNLMKKLSFQSRGHGEDIENLHLHDAEIGKKESPDPADEYERAQSRAQDQEEPLLQQVIAEDEHQTQANASSSHQGENRDRLQLITEKIKDFLYKLVL